MTSLQWDPARRWEHLLELCVAGLVVVVIVSACALFMVLASS
jgi:hypothetical protein